MSDINLANRIDFYIEGLGYFEFYINLINEAKYSIQLHTYIFDMDAFGIKVYEALIKASQRGVQVYLLIDGVGSKNFSTLHEIGFPKLNFYFYRFNTLNLKWLYQWGRRLHHKVIIIDQIKAIVGGINVTTSGYGHKYKTQQLDFAVYLEGPILVSLNEYCHNLFQSSYPYHLPLRFINFKNIKFNYFKKYIKLKISINDWINRKWQITKQYSQLVQSAKTNITIMNPYFFPRKIFIDQLVSAAQRGVRVRLILPLISDWPSYLIASEYLYFYFLNNNIEIYKWTKSVLHGKLATVDGHYTTIGSFNLNYTSYQQNLELNLDIDSVVFTKKIDCIIEKLIEDGCEKIDFNLFNKSSSYFVQILRFINYTILSCLSTASVSLIFQEKGVGHLHRNLYIKVRIILTIILIFSFLISIFISFKLSIILFIICLILILIQYKFNTRLTYK